MRRMTIGSNYTQNQNEFDESLCHYLIYFSKSVDDMRKNIALYYCLSAIEFRKCYIIN